MAYQNLLIPSNSLLIIKKSKPENKGILIQTTPLAFSIYQKGKKKLRSFSFSSRGLKGSALVICNQD